MLKIKENDKWLITIDLDGTTIGKHDDDPANVVIPEINIKAIKELKKRGHHVAIVTGRPWRLTKDIYQKLNIDTIVVNNNGSMIHRPNDFGFKRIKTGMNRKFIQEILEINWKKNLAENIIIDFDNEAWCINLDDEEFMNNVHITRLNKESKVVSFNKKTILETDPYVVALKFDKTKVDLRKIITELRRRYGNALAFRYWELKDNYYSLEINPLGASKGSALKIIASYYNIRLDKTIAFGDGLNDITMMQMANFGIAMKNGTNTLLDIADDVTDFTNEEGGVGKYLNEFFNLGL